jgi:hypothetical protein
MYLDDHPNLCFDTAYGNLGRHGDLGYEGKSIQVCGARFSHGLSAHAPSKVKLSLDPGFQSFSCQVALNDDAPPAVSWADFQVRVDGRLCALEGFVQKGDPPRRLEVSIASAGELELVAETWRWEHCHSVWLDPRLSEKEFTPVPGKLADPLARVEFTVPCPLPRAERCIATIISPGFEDLLEDMLVSLAWRGGVPDALVVVFAIDPSKVCERIAREHGALIVPCERRGPLNSTVKSVLYSVARVIDARQFVCLDADMLVLGEIQPLFAALETTPPGSILVCREGNGHGLRDLNHAIHAVYGGRPADLGRITNGGASDGNFDLPVNDGMFAGGRTALLALDGLLRQWPGARAWVDDRKDVWWRNQFVFNLALARLNCAVELHAGFNLQLNSQEVSLEVNPIGQMDAIWQGQEVRILHFNGNGRHKYLQWREEFHQRAKTAIQGRIPLKAGHHQTNGAEHSRTSDL